MSHKTAEEKLRRLDIELPTPAPPGGSYCQFTTTGNLVYVAGQTPVDSEGTILFKGKCGADHDVASAYKAATLCGINLLTNLKVACGGDLERVEKVVKVNGYCACTPDFTEHPKVINGASDLFVEVFGEKGRHARTAIGVQSLPFGAVVEVEAIVQIKPVSKRASLGSSLG
eukprot:CAMPEP_0169449236 /NCGR_PEP_ID=MMETSP1042-20121227/12498_1 /TAXON_ID=464988 /ORGANISM="Hemiselmis andersenii, Strain CCMP1180" /LENGTH=170 /DNA_ID=CAMNT_0009560951 /DNA_START=175 /DNA_END=684 /DNA_ORIENTATION=+